MSRPKRRPRALEFGYRRIKLGLESLEDRRLLATFTVADNGDAGVGTLRQAILDANAAAGMDAIEFNIPGGGTQTISVASPLPDITDPVVIDGYTQPGASPNTNPVTQPFNGILTIELDGTGVGATGLRLAAGSDGSTLRGLVINRFDTPLTDAIEINSANNRIEGNLIGVDPTGLMAQPNDGGLFLSGGSADNNVIGGTTAAARNIISGNNFDGILFDLTEVTNTSNRIVGNFIGVDATGAGALGNGRQGIFLAGASNVVGGTNSNASNVIAFSGSDGVQVGLGNGHSLLGNSVFSNSGRGIGLGAFSVPNDPGDGDVGLNNLQNSPELMPGARIAGGNLSIEYLVDSTDGNSAYPLTVQFFIADGDGQEGQTLLGSDSYVLAEAQTTKAVSFPAGALVTGDQIVATATDANGNTSEFSAAFSVLTTETEVSLDASGDLLIDDVATKADTLTLRFDNATNEFVITDPNHIVEATTPNAIQVDPNTVRVPITDVTDAGGDEVIVTTRDDADSVTIDSSVTDAVALGVSTLNYAGGSPTEPPGDQLALTGSATDVNYRFDNASDGAVIVDGFAIEYTGLEPVTDNMDAANRVFGFNAGAETITLDDPDPMTAGQMRINSDVGGGNGYV